MSKFRVTTRDSILLINRVMVIKAASKEALLEDLKATFPNSQILGVEELEHVDET